MERIFHQLNNFIIRKDASLVEEVYNWLNLLQNSGMSRVFQENVNNSVFSKPVDEHIFDSIFGFCLLNQLIDNSEPLKSLLYLLAFGQEPINRGENVFVHHLIFFLTYFHQQLKILFHVFTIKLQKAIFSYGHQMLILFHVIMVVNWVSLCNEK